MKYLVTSLLVKWNIIAHIIVKNVFIWPLAVSAVQFNTIFSILLEPIIYLKWQNYERNLSYISVNVLYQLASMYYLQYLKILWVFLILLQQDSKQRHGKFTWWFRFTQQHLPISTPWKENYRDGSCIKGPLRTIWIYAELCFSTPIHIFN